MNRGWGLLMALFVVHAAAEPAPFEPARLGHVDLVRIEASLPPLPIESALRSPASRARQERLEQVIAELAAHAEIDAVLTIEDAAGLQELSVDLTDAVLERLQTP